MAKSLDISVLGDKALSRKLKKLPGVAQGKVVRPAMRAAAKEIVLPAIRAEIHDVTGNLSRNLMIRAAKSKAFTGVLVMPGTREKMGIPNDDPYYYPSAVEFGHGNVPAHPFLRPGMD